MKTQLRRLIKGCAQPSGAILALALCWLGMQPSSAAPSPSPRPPINTGALYNDAVNADDHVSYYATLTSVVYEGDHAVSTVARIEHQAPHSWRIWYMAPADAYGRLIISNEQQAYEYDASKGKVISHDWYQSAPGVAEPVNTAEVLSNYAVELGPASSVAGRPSRILSLVSRHNNSVVQRIWVDDKTKLILRREKYNSEGAVISQTGFDSIRVGVDFPAGLFALGVPKGMTLVPGFDYGSSTHDVSQLLKAASFNVAVPQYLPEGFALTSGSIATHNGVQTVQLVYGDGLRTFSLFENASARLPTFRETTPTALRIGQADGETANIEGQTLVSWNDRGLNLTIVGDLSEKESASIGASIHP